MTVKNNHETLCLKRRKSHICKYKKTSWGASQCIICYEWYNEQFKCDICRPFIIERIKR